MFKAIYFLGCVICFAHCFAQKNDNSKIVGGVVVPIENVPYQVALYRYHGRFSECSGTIIHEYAVLTAAHCVVGLLVDDVMFSAGSSSNNRSGSLHRADWIVTHYDYDYATLKNDIAFVKVVEPFVISPQVQIASLPTSKPTVPTQLVASGWGDLYVEGAQLQSVIISTIAENECNTRYANFDLQPSDDMLCAGATNSAIGPCNGDAGGPLVFVNGKQYTLYGIFIWRGTCDSIQYPAVFVDVFTFKSFIDENISYIRQ